MLIELLNRRGFAGRFDFLYLPADFVTKCNLGYSFVNLIHPDDAIRFVEVFDGFKEWDCGTNRHKSCVVDWGAIQGFRANVGRFKSKKIIRLDIPEEYKPVLFWKGIQIPFESFIRTSPCQQVEPA
mmetsp:Transcript_101112/g.274802  ORF Transcript_101112/g.274802 Transcript_101112/m.274802 type:complete len:126 (+) Transcript_101112:3-380(+)